jgi:hypothetical protein
MKGLINTLCNTPLPPITLVSGLKMYSKLHDMFYFTVLYMVVVCKVKMVAV